MCQSTPSSKLSRVVERKPSASALRVAALEAGLKAEELSQAPCRTEIAQPSQSWALFLVLGHALCASCLLVVNKWAMKEFPFVWTLTTLQFGFAAVSTWLLGRLGLVEVNALELGKLAKFFPAAGMFFITITAGNAVVASSNVDTFIVMRSVVPIPCALLESLILKEPYPAPRSWAGLGVVLLGAVGYSMMNQGLLVNSAAWVVLYLVLMPLDGILIKHLVSESGLSPWGLVLYNNVCALLPGLLFSTVLELSRPAEVGAMAMMIMERPILAGAPIVLSCWSGLAISYFQLNVRKVISSTAFMVLGVSNKILSVLLNQLASLDSNADVSSVGSVMASIAGAILFQQTVKGKGISQAPKADARFGEHWARILVVLGVLAAAAISYLEKKQGPTSHA
jgi:drug/metabolite transporter (DMT)-like permease